MFDLNKELEEIGKIHDYNMKVINRVFTATMILLGINLALLLLGAYGIIPHVVMLVVILIFQPILTNHLTKKYEGMNNHETNT